MQKRGACAADHCSRNASISVPVQTGARLGLSLPTALSCRRRRRCTLSTIAGPSLRRGARRAGLIPRGRQCPRGHGVSDDGLSLHRLDGARLGEASPSCSVRSARGTGQTHTHTHIHARTRARTHRSTRAHAVTLTHTHTRCSAHSHERIVPYGGNAAPNSTDTRSWQRTVSIDTLQPSGRAVQPPLPGPGMLPLRKEIAAAAAAAAAAIAGSAARASLKRRGTHGRSRRCGGCNACGRAAAVVARYIGMLHVT